MPNDQLKKVINKLETCKVIEAELGQYRDLSELQKLRLASKDSIISSYNSQISNYKLMVINFEKSSENYKNLVGVLKEQNKIRDKIIRRQKSFKYLAAGVGLGIGILISK